MNDTSFAILPDKEYEQHTRYRSVGALVSHAFESKHILEMEAENGYVTIIFYRDDIVRIMMNPKKKPSKQTTRAVIKKPVQLNLSLKENQEELYLKSKKLSLHINKTPLLISVFDQNGSLLLEEADQGMAFNETKGVICYKQMVEDQHFYGFGEKTGYLDKRGEKLTMWNTDVYAPHNPETDPIYQSIPYFMAVRQGKAYGIFLDNPSKSIFDLKSSTETYSFLAERGQLDYYIFGGPTPKHVIEQYTAITGKMPLPPKWALGYHQSRYSYKTEQEVRELVQTFKEKSIPLDAVYLDIHHMDGYRVFTFDQERFSNPEKLIEELRVEGVHIVPIVDPGVKADPEYYLYQEGIRGDMLCKYLDGEIFHGDVWPGKSAFPDFTKKDVRRWWGESHQFYTKLGIEGVWNDMNEPSVFNESKTMDLNVVHDNDGDPKTHRELHNLYGLLMGEATYDGLKKQIDGKRPFLLTRAGYAGIQRYATVWTGDNRSFWEHLQMALPMCMNLGISGVPFCGPDVGGFAHDSNGQLLARWTQFGTFTPYFRNHCELKSIHQEPWSFGEKYEQIIKRYIQERYRWLPYLYTLFQEASTTGLPVMRALMLEYPNDQHTVNLSDQFMIGSNLIVAPILTPDTFHRVVYLPEGTWVNYWTDERLSGGNHYLVEADLETLPLFVKEGSIITHGTVKGSTKQDETLLKIHLYPSKEGKASFTYYEDDGKSFAYEHGEFFKAIITAEMELGKLDITCKTSHSQYEPVWEDMEFIIHGLEEGKTVFINGEKQANSKLIEHEKMIICAKRQHYFK
ncbi:alpha-glucosidase [Bacillus sp. 7504-2]|nr:alpha-glucosidase [Bacillus sp. 7504-2]